MRFSRVFPRVYDTNMLVSKTQVKTQEKCKKNTRKIQNASPTREDVSILLYPLGKNASQLRFARILLTFCSHFGHKPDQNANPTYSVIWSLAFVLSYLILSEYRLSCYQPSTKTHRTIQGDQVFSW